MRRRAIGAGASGAFAAGRHSAHIDGRSRTKTAGSNDLSGRVFRLPASGELRVARCCFGNRAEGHVVAFHGRNAASLVFDAMRHALGRSERGQNRDDTIAVRGQR